MLRSCCENEINANDAHQLVDELEYLFICVQM